MIYNREFALGIFKKLGFEEINTVIGNCIRMNNYDAIKYAIIAGHGYLDENANEYRHIIPRDLFRIFNQIGSYEKQFGLFYSENTEFFKNIKQLILEHPFLVENEKYICIVEYDKPKDLDKKIENIIERLNENGVNPNDFILHPIRNKKATQYESFIEYVFSEILNRMGYITDTQIPFIYGVGTPDIAAYKIDDVQEALVNYFGNEGFSVIELMLIKSDFWKFKEPKKLLKNLFSPDQFIVGEVKTDSKDGSQISKYIAQNLFDSAYEIILHKKNKSDYSGLINFDTVKSNFYISKHEMLLSVESQLRNRYHSWLKNYMKYYLVTNLSPKKWARFQEENQINSTNMIVKINAMDLSTIINEIEKDDTYV